MALFNVNFFSSWTCHFSYLRAFGVTQKSPLRNKGFDPWVVSSEPSHVGNAQMPFLFSGISMSSWIKCEPVSVQVIDSGLTWRVECLPSPPLSSSPLCPHQQDSQSPLLPMALPTCEDHKALFRWPNRSCLCSWSNRQFRVESLGWKFLSRKFWTWKRGRMCYYSSA